MNEQKYKKNFEFMLRRIGEDYVIAKRNEVYRVNEVGARIYDLCNGKNSKTAICKKLSEYYLAMEEEILEDIEIFMKEMIELNVIVIA